MTSYDYVSKVQGVNVSVVHKNKHTTKRVISAELGGVLVEHNVSFVCLNV